MKLSAILRTDTFGMSRNSEHTQNIYLGARFLTALLIYSRLNEHLHDLRIVGVGNVG